MKVLFICGREIDYTRNQVLLRAFKRIGDVDAVVKTGITKSLTIQSIKLSLRSIPKYFFSTYDLLFVGFYGHFLMIPAGILSRKPIIFDAFVSTYDTLVNDRLSYLPQSSASKLAAFLDRLSCRLADKILVDTPGQVQYFNDTFGIPREKMYSVPVSCNEDLFFPRRNLSPEDGITSVLSYSSYLPIHGIGTIIRAAEILKNEPFHFKLIGNGTLYQSMVKSAKDAGLENISFLPPVSLQVLSDEIASSDICLGGHFGVSDKARRVIPGKIYQMLAMQKPVIAADSPANKELLQHGFSAYLCPADDPTALAIAIRDLQRDSQLSERIARQGRLAFEKFASEEVVTNILREIITQLKLTGT
jgi:glycosyltransferase involved in cell wall biosynthesis